MKKVLIIVIIVLVCISGLMFVDMGIEKGNRSWDNGEITFNNKKINLPISVNDFSKELDIKIDTSRINSFNFYSLFRDEATEGLIELYIKDNMVYGIKVDSEYLNGLHDDSVGKKVIFPEDVNTNKTSDEIQKEYKTGIFNFYIRKNITMSQDYNARSYKISTVKFSGKKYDLVVDEVIRDEESHRSIFYYYK